MEKPLLCLCQGKENNRQQFRCVQHPDLRSREGKARRGNEGDGLLRFFILARSTCTEQRREQEQQQQQQRREEEEEEGKNDDERETNHSHEEEKAEMK